MEQESLISLTLIIGLSAIMIITFIILKLLENKSQNNSEDKKDNTDNGSDAGIEAGFTEPTTHDSDSSNYYDGNGYGY
jgi:NADH:ubiquinone oxidoreductase subunit 3 (subunit A)